MLARSLSYTTLGLEALPVTVEADVARGLPALTIVGLPDQAVKEARDRVRSAIINSQYHIPSQRVTINLAPADVRKEGGLFDLAIALALLAASGQLDPESVAGVVAIGELTLAGGLRPIRGALIVAMAMAQDRGGRTDGPCLLLPIQNAAEVSVVRGVRAIPVASLTDAVEFLAGRLVIAPVAGPPARVAGADRLSDADFRDVKGQDHAKRALEIAAAGGHHALLIGPPGSGKTMLAQRLPSILPDLTLEEALETTRIHSVAGLLNDRPLVRQRPFRNPHHTSSAIALIGGGTHPKPGEISLAHHGVLFLDELPEFHRHVLESLREPLEAGTVHVARASRSVIFPARFLLVGAMNPCPDGWLTDPHRRCRCSSTQIQRYLSRISGPLLDRIDLHVDVPAVPFDALTHAPSGETSAQIRVRVIKAQKWCHKRGQKHANAQLSSRELKTHCEMTSEAARLLKSAMQELALSARSYTKILKIARTIADLSGEERLQPAHIAEAVQYRGLDRRWASQGRALHAAAPAARATVQGDGGHRRSVRVDRA